MITNNSQIYLLLYYRLSIHLQSYVMHMFYCMNSGNYNVI